MLTKPSPIFASRDIDVADDFNGVSSGHGKLTHGPQANALVERTLDFVRDELPRWRDRQDRREEDAEEALNAQLCKHLDARARHHLRMVQFHHEERQARRRRVDISAGRTEGGFIGTTYHSIDDPFVVFEGKRLPAPDKTREREYVTGGEEKSGGIQRFKLGLHGAQFTTVGMIGYIQKDLPRRWHDQINLWIRDLAGASPLGQEKWETGEQLAHFTEDARTLTASCVSSHSRVGAAVSLHIDIYHLWIQMCKVPHLSDAN
jgi:hypothetical protein